MNKTGSKVRSRMREHLLLFKFNADSVAKNKAFDNCMNNSDSFRADEEILPRFL